MLDGIGFVILNTDDGAVYIERFHEDLDADDDLFAMLEHELMVASKIWFALDAIDDEHFGFLTGRRQQFDVRREASATEAYDTSCGYLIDDRFGFEGALALQFVGAVDLGQPVITFYIDEDSLSWCVPCIFPFADLGDRTTDRRTDVRADESAGFSQQFAYFDFSSDFYDRLCRCADMLHKRDDSLLRQRALLNRLMRGELFVILRMNTADMKGFHNLMYNLTMYKVQRTMYNVRFIDLLFEGEG